MCFAEHKVHRVHKVHKVLLKLKNALYIPPLIPTARQRSNPAHYSKRKMKT